MFWPRPLLSSLLALLTAVAPALAITDTPDVHTIGVLAFEDLEATEARWQPTADYLSESISDAAFRIRALDYADLNRAVESGELDFVLTNTGHYVRLEAQQGITRLATLIGSEQGQPVRQFGGVVLVPAGREDLQTLPDLRGQRLLAVDQDSLGGWQAGHFELHRAGIDPFEDLESLTFTGMPHRLVIDALLAGEADAGMVRTGLLESLIEAGEIPSDALRVLQPRETAEFPLAHTTRLYPEWPFSRLDHTPDAIAEAVTIALLRLPADHLAASAGGYHGWSAPLSYTPVHQLFETLGLPPYEPTLVLDLRALLEARPEIPLGFLLALLLLSTLAVVHYRRLNAQLALEVDQRREAESRLRAHEARLAYQAGHDPLTGLPNRVLLHQRLESAMAEARHQKDRIAVLFMDLDRFKTINDSLGHAVGDELLQILGERLKERFRAQTVARIGGDEFIVVLDDIRDRPDVEARARELLELIAESFAVGGWRDLQVGASIGISLFPDHARDAGELITQADAAMYEAKDAGRNTFRFYSHSMTEAASRRLEIENRLRRALAQDELEVFYQPQVRMATGRITGVEALVRWRDPEEGLISPNVFIPVAEETGLIGAVGDFVLEQACRQVIEWDRSGHSPLEVSVNLSGHQIAAPGLPRRIRQVLRDTGLEPRRLTLEITESTLMHQAEATRGTLEQLKSLGVLLAIDDFGTGYSSLAYLKEFAIDILKIDQTFVRDLPEDRNDVELTMAIISMAHNLGLDVLAEGVETEAQRSFLASQGCDAWQGYLTTPPVPPKRVIELVQSSHPSSARQTGS
ncbi:bifunctional diguanylate cyclase/phosphodiesterase [Thioalkalivibrio sp. ALJ2]|uniref:putative bifunctional diguanylate cyclase/phosphodiesterase n=1 Tax=Thioalkalivibrio sp. ALJ2 TaxID=1261622 RepID=UPI00037DB2D6|nr:EAL domain-containing protein [Thioalkalivibrio sp. ALJ2]